jgi:DNA-binding CsgD family transcriptional regulator
VRKTGKSSKEMAGELFVSPHTIDTHRRHLLEKTNCTDTTGIIMQDS